jgi:hypothetical protein
MWNDIDALPTWVQMVLLLFGFALGCLVFAVRHQIRLGLRNKKALNDKQRELDSLKMKQQKDQIHSLPRRILDNWRINPT